MFKFDFNFKFKIFINDDEVMIRKKINFVWMDSISVIVGEYDFVNRLGVVNLFEILGGFMGKMGEKVVEECKDVMLV